jgi:DNA ligase-1
LAALHCRHWLTPEILSEVRARCPDFTRIAAALSAGGIDELSERVPLRIGEHDHAQALHRIGLTFDQGTPLAPMLGSITRSLPDMHSRLGPRKFVSEFKYDGQRVQVSHVLATPLSGILTNSSRSTLAMCRETPKTQTGDARS